MLLYVYFSATTLIRIKKKKYEQGFRTPCRPLEIYNI